MNAPFFGDVVTASDAVLVVLVLMLELALAVVESEAARGMVEALLASRVLVSFVVAAVAAGVGEGAAAAAPPGFCCVCECMCLCVLLVFANAFVCVQVDRDAKMFKKRRSSIQPRTLLVLPETLPHLRSVSMETNRLYLKIWICGNKGEKMRICHFEL